MTATRDRRLAAGLWALSPLVILLLGATLIGQPELMPTHWGLGDEVDAVATGGAYLATAFSATAAAAAGSAIVGGLARFVSSGVSRWLMTTLTAVGAGFTFAYLFTAIATNRAVQPAEVSPGWTLLALLWAAAWGYLAWIIHRRSIPARQDVLAAVPERARLPHLAEPVAMAWVGQMTSATMKSGAVFVAAIAVITIGILIGSGSGWAIVVFTGALLVATAVASALLAALEFTVSSDGLRGKTVLGSLQVFNVPADQILGLALTKIEPMEWGGHGLRTSRRGTAYVASGGPGVVIYRANGINLAIEFADESQATHAYDALAASAVGAMQDRA